MKRNRWPVWSGISIEGDANGSIKGTSTHRSALLGEGWVCGEGVGCGNMLRFSEKWPIVVPMILPHTYLLTNA